VKTVPGFLIDTAHPNHKDYVRFAAMNPRDPRKARKVWEKEIVTRNSEVFEFLRLRILNSTTDSDANSSAKTDEESRVTFQILVRQKSDGKFVPFQVAMYIYCDNKL
jgi:hypothetical protein